MQKEHDNIPRSLQYTHTLPFVISNFDHLSALLAMDKIIRDNRSPGVKTIGLFVSEIDYSRSLQSPEPRINSTCMSNSSSIMFVL